MAPVGRWRPQPRLGSRPSNRTAGWEASSANQRSTSRLRASRPRFTSIATSQQLIADTSRPAEPPGRPALSIS